MEASSYGPGAVPGGGTGAGPGGGPVGREADVAPAPAAPLTSRDPTAGRTAGFWEPANPAPLGLAGFAATTMMLSLVNGNLIRGAGLFYVLAFALAYGGIAQLLAGMWEFRTGNTFGAVAFSSYGAFWLSFFFLVKLFPASALYAHGLAAYLYIWGGFTTYMFFASLRTTAAIALVFLLLAITFILLGIAHTGSGNLTVLHWGGYIGIATAAAAFYASFAQVLNSTFGHVVLPLIPLAARPAATP